MRRTSTKLLEVCKDEGFARKNVGGRKPRAWQTFCEDNWPAGKKPSVSLSLFLEVNNPESNHKLGARSLDGDNGQTI